MNLFSQIATMGLNAKARFTSANISGTPQIGMNQETISMPDANVAYTFDALLVDASTSATIELVSNTDNGDFAWVEGVPQVNTATAVGTITLAGSATITVTAAGMTGSPKAISVAVASGDTAEVWAGKVRTALAADADVSALFTVGGTGADFSLTRKPLETYPVGTESIPVYPATDATLNIAYTNGTCTGITPDATSASTTAGTATSGVYAPDVDGKDFEGVAIPSGWKVLAIQIKGISGDAEVSSAALGMNLSHVAANDCMLVNTYGTQPDATGDIEISTGSLTSVVSVTVFGKL